ncbi:MAG: hypothetical protein ABJN73_13580 [Nonlabens ulvanivorans]|uniref:Membrane protein n=3 Tax=Nonlabens ulvanivorans TaxID=906888 RepID=A0A084JVE4_NONUL|nr:hypothetical protein [Nonlabens ulvanivorans]KEZ92928.1 membrane protein [Nonlabens ulvanivorans]PRX12843.1 hypothetical protein LY02_02495 [Nonlabens ulvanivorans]GAK75694.1 hypothetical protein JCM19296_1286 [Nonlabens ulvanivorans]GAL75420.1 hypothetical protein JCM19275_1871 [Nonlabens ulvanivorans]
MKNKAIRWVIFTTAFLVLVTILSSYNVTFKWIFSLVVLGQASLIISVYLVLRDEYSTTLTFKDGYQDHHLEKDIE